MDKNGTNLVDGGGDTVYGSNRDVYAPGGQAVLVDTNADILYYHYRMCIKQTNKGTRTLTDSISELLRRLRLQREFFPRFY